ncbi:MFS general substrate transporter [Rhizodiscina lignyota]|uniref:MFS general substrate transporter n=1 Tax=Rhizodiscina lignyota TaxID=1504668 RepID=A0A9P4IJ19_9PEZI|nr:MFS general substrate transporter [Rhizodiscina lignyota]
MADHLTSDVEKPGFAPGKGTHQYDENIEELVQTEVEVIELSEEEKSKVLRKIDWILVPQLTILYLLAFLDRSNIGNAKIAGMTEDLNLVGLDYNVALSIFFVSYSFFEIPSNIVLKIIRPNIWISLIMVVWGVIMTLMGIVQSYSGLLAARFFLGVAEAGLFPGATYLLTLWYRRYEVQKRMAWFYVGASLSGAFSGLLAYAIQKMDGIAGLGGWRWYGIFILEGILSAVVGFCIVFTLPNSPWTAKFLTKEQAQFVVSRLQVETGSGAGRVTNDDKIRLHHVIKALKEWKIWMGVICWWGNAITVYGFTYTVPTVITQLGYSNANAQLMTIPIYVAAMVATIVLAYISDRYQQRAWVIAGGFGFGSLGFLALLVVPHPRLPGLTYGMLFPAAMGIYAPLMPLLSWFANNLAPSSKRAVGMALLICFGNLGGGLVGSNIFLDRLKPHYYVGYGVCFAIMLAASATAIFLRTVYARINHKRDQLTEAEIRALYTEGELLDMGDKSPFFRYAL